MSVQQVDERTEGIPGRRDSMSKDVLDTAWQAQEVRLA